MTGLRRALLLVAVEGLVVGLVALALVASSDHVEAPVAQGLIIVFIGWSFIGVGLYAWWRRPENRFGVLMSAVGFAWFLQALTAADSSWLFTIGVLVSSLYAAVFVHMVLAFPSGRLEDARLQVVQGCGYAICDPRPGADPAFSGPDRRGLRGLPALRDPDHRQRTLEIIFNTITSVLAVVLVGYVLYVLLQRWQRRDAARSAARSRPSCGRASSC